MSDAVVCPYCRMDFAGSGPAKVFCTACGTPHHEDCYAENGGCTVFGCPKAPADDPKLQISQHDLFSVNQGSINLASTLAAQPASMYGQYSPQMYARPAYASGLAKSRTTFILLGVFLGMFGAHNFYAGYTGKAVGQLCLSVLTIGFLLIVAWIWAIVEICVVDKDSAGIQFS
jgi:TM2 domain-containing membrane protein YozV